MGIEDDFKANADSITQPPPSDPPPPTSGDSGNGDSGSAGTGNTENTIERPTSTNSPPDSQDLKLG